MGYTTNFTGSVSCTPALTPAQVAYLQKFAQTRRMKRDENKAAALPDPVREAVGLPLGAQAEYFVGGLGWCGQDRDPSVVNSNTEPSTQPGLWCKWEPTDNGKSIRWNGAEKFYDYVEWLRYLNENFLKEWGIKIDGAIKWKGEDSADRGVIVATNGRIETLEGDAYKQYVREQKDIKAAQKQNKTIHAEVADNIRVARANKVKL